MSVPYINLEFKWDSNKDFHIFKSKVDMLMHIWNDKYMELLI